MNHFTLPSRFIRSLHSIIDRYLQYQVIVIVVDENGVEFIVSNNNDFSLRLRINKLSIKDFQFTEAYVSHLKLEDFKAIQNINNQFYKFQQNREDVKVFDPSNNTPLQILQMIQMAQELPKQNDKWFSQISLTPEIYQKIISECSFLQEKQNVYIEISEKDTKILCNNKQMAKLTQPSPNSLNLLLPRKAFNVFDVLVSGEKQKKDVQLSLSETLTQQLSFINDFIQVNIQFYATLLDKEKFNSFIIEDGNSFLKLLTQYHKYVYNEAEFTISENLLQIHFLDYCHVALVYVSIPKEYLKEFKFEQLISQTFPLGPIVKELKSKKVRNLEIKINEFKLIIKDIKENKQVEVTSTGQKDILRVEDFGQTKIKLQKSELANQTKQFSKKSLRFNTNIEVKQDNIKFEQNEQIVIQNIEILEKTQQDFQVSLSTKYLHMFTNLYSNLEGEITMSFGKNVPAVLEEIVKNKFRIQMYLAPKISDDDD